MSPEVHERAASDRNGARADGYVWGRDTHCINQQRHGEDGASAADDTRMRPTKDPESPARRSVIRPFRRAIRQRRRPRGSMAHRPADGPYRRSPWRRRRRGPRRQRRRASGSRDGRGAEGRSERNERAGADLHLPHDLDRLAGILHGRKPPRPPGLEAAVQQIELGAGCRRREPLRIRRRPVAAAAMEDHRPAAGGGFCSRLESGWCFAAGICSRRHSSLSRMSTSTASWESRAKASAGWMCLIVIVSFLCKGFRPGGSRGDEARSSEPRSAGRRSGTRASGSRGGSQ